MRALFFWISSDRNENWIIANTWHFWSWDRPSFVLLLATSCRYCIYTLTEDRVTKKNNNNDTQEIAFESLFSLFLALALAFAVEWISLSLLFTRLLLLYSLILIASCCYLVASFRIHFLVDRLEWRLQWRWQRRRLHCRLCLRRRRRRRWIKP